MKSRNPARTPLLALILLVSAAAPAPAQGCSACRDNTAGSAPAVQKSLRRAIPVLALPAAGALILLLTLAGRSQKQDEKPD